MLRKEFTTFLQCLDLLASEKLLNLDWIKSELISFLAASFVGDPREEVSDELFAEFSDRFSERFSERRKESLTC